MSTLLYHSFADSTTTTFQELTVAPSLFAEHLDALQEAGCQFIRFQDIPSVVAGSVSEGPASNPVVAVTVDDGLADVLSGAAPALATRGIPATLFVPTAYVGACAEWLPGEDGYRVLCDWKALCDLTAAGWEVASHGHRHIAADISSPSTVTADALRSRTLLDDHLGVAVGSFAYPFGYFSKQGRNAVKEAGFLQAGIVTGARDRSIDDRWRIPRTQIGPATTPEEIVALVRDRRGDARLLNRTKQRLWLFGRRRFHWGPAEASAVGAPDCSNTSARPRPDDG